MGFSLEASAPLHSRACMRSRAFFAWSVACIQTGVLSAMHLQVYGACAFFAWSVACIQTGVLSVMHVQVCTLNRCCEHQRTRLRTRSLQGVHMRSCMRSLFIQRWWTRVGGFS